MSSAWTRAREAVGLTTTPTSSESVLTRAGVATPSHVLRPTYAPAPSLCRALPGFTTVDEYPIRSPLAVADFLAPIVRGRAFTEIGTRNGDVMACLAHFARRVTAIELDAGYCKKLRQRGFEVLCKPVETVTPAQLVTAAESEVYFWWPMWSPKQNEAWLRQLIAAHRAVGTPAVAYVAHDSHWAPDMRTLARLAPYYHATNVTRIFFDEGDKVGNMRPGQWGVFHVARFELGPNVPLPPKQGSDTLALPTVRPPGSRPAEAPWLKGFCGVTEGSEDVSQACATADQGSLPLGAKLGIRTRQQCVEFCYTRCGRCRYVSFSKELGDCSWYHKCDTSLLQTTLNNAQMPFFTRAVQPRVNASSAPMAAAIEEAWSKEALAARAAKRAAGGGLGGRRSSRLTSGVTR